MDFPIQKAEEEPGKRGFWEAEVISRLGRICAQSHPAMGRRVPAGSKARGGSEWGDL